MVRDTLVFVDRQARRVVAVVPGMSWGTAAANDERSPPVVRRGRLDVACTKTPWKVFRGFISHSVLARRRI